MKTTTFTSVDASEPLSAVVARLIRKITQGILFQIDMNNFQKPSHSTRFSQGLNINGFKKNFKRNYLLLVPLVIFGGLLIYMIGSFFVKDGSSVQGASDQRAVIQKPLATEQLNKPFTFKVAGDDGKETAIRYVIENAELRDQIIVKGQPYTAIKGRVFVTVNLKITNSANSSVSLYTKDFVRLTVNNSGEKLAPEINNDPVQVQAISTKYTRLGFTINDTDKNLVLQVGEITGKKESIDLHLQ